MDKYTAWKVILDEPIWLQLIQNDFSSCVLVQIYPILYSQTSNDLFILHLINEAWLFKRLKTIYIPYCTVQYFIKFLTTFLLLELPHIACIKCMILLGNVTRCFTRLSVYLKSSAYMTTCFFHSDTFYSQRLLSLKNNGKVHLHLIIQYEKIRTFGSNMGKYWTVTWYK